MTAPITPKERDELAKLRGLVAEADAARNAIAGYEAALQLAVDTLWQICADGHHPDCHVWIDPACLDDDCSCPLGKARQGLDGLGERKP